MIQTSVFWLKFWVNGVTFDNKKGVTFIMETTLYGVPLPDAPKVMDYWLQLYLSVDEQRAEWEWGMLTFGPPENRLEHPFEGFGCPRGAVKQREGDVIPMKFVLSKSGEAYVLKAAEIPEDHGRLASGEVIGGGYIDIDLREKTLSVSGGSTRYGKFPSTHWPTITELIERAMHSQGLTDWKITIP